MINPIRVSSHLEKKKEKQNPMELRVKVYARDFVLLVKTQYSVWLGLR